MTRFPIETVSWPGNRIENDTVSKRLHGTYPIVKSNRLCQGDLVLRALRFRSRLHGRGFQSKRFHDLETASKTTRFRRVYTEPIRLNPTVYVKKISFSERFDINGLAVFALRQLDLGTSKESISMSSRRFVFLSWLRLQKKKTPSMFSWTDDEVELLLKVTNEYKVSKAAENVDRESVHKKYSDILDRFKDELEKRASSQFRARPVLYRCGFVAYATNETVSSFWKRSTLECNFKTTQFW